MKMIKIVLLIKMAKTWLQALREYNKGAGVWAIPRSGTTVHEHVIKLKNGTVSMDKIDPRIQLPKKAIRVKL